MRVVLDTNILLSALMVRGIAPGRLYELWRRGRFDLVCAERQLKELNMISSRYFFQGRIKPSEMGRIVTGIRCLAVMCDLQPPVSEPIDQDDAFLLAIAQEGNAEYLVTGDESNLLTLMQHGSTRVVTASEMVSLLEQNVQGWP